MMFYIPAASIIWLLVCIRTTFSQSVAPSNRSQDLGPVSTTPRFLLNGTELHGLGPISLAPLAQFANMDYNTFADYRITGQLVTVDASNANNGMPNNQISYVSCDPSAYTGNLDATTVFDMVVQNSQSTNFIILYSTTSDHCNATGLSALTDIKSILTTTSPMMAASLAALNLGLNSAGSSLIYPDFNSYTQNSSHGNDYASGGPLGQPTTAVAMIILYSITGLITALFVIIIITGAIRAHRHPERYGPRNVTGRSRQSRAKGIARAMLETLPIVKFGDQPDINKKATDGTDIELNQNRGAPTDTINRPDASSQPVTESPTGSDTVQVAHQAEHTSKADGTGDDGQLGCSICTEDFTRGEEVRVLPCNHKFHPDCVDPWLLNVSGTCPLCRIDLRPQGADATTDGQPGSMTDDIPEDALPPPLAATGPIYNTGRTANLLSLAAGTREERIAALRSLRQERRSVGHRAATEDERRGLTRRFRERFRIRTERRGTVVVPNDNNDFNRQNSTASIP